MIGLTTYNRWCNYYIPNLTGTLDGRAPLMGPAAARAIATTFGMIARPQELHGQKAGEMMTKRVGVCNLLKHALPRPRFSTCNLLKHALNRGRGSACFRRLHVRLFSPTRFRFAIYSI